MLINRIYYVNILYQIKYISNQINNILYKIIKTHKVCIYLFFYSNQYCMKEN